MAAHLCNPSDLTKEMLREILRGRNRQDDQFTCGSCSKTFETICVLHSHCTRHSKGGSYYFDHVTGTAFPKYDSTCSYVQVKPADFDKPPDLSDRIIGASVAADEQPVSESKDIADNTDADNLEHPDENITTATHFNLKQCEENITMATQFNMENSDGNITSATVSDDVNTGQANSSCTDAYLDTQGMTKNETSFVLVSVRNLRRMDNGSISFEMNKKDSHLSDATATALMTHMGRCDQELLKEGAVLQLQVPNHGNSAQHEQTREGSEQFHKDIEDVTQKSQETQSAEIVEMTSIENHQCIASKNTYVDSADAIGTVIEAGGTGSSLVIDNGKCVSSSTVSISNAGVSHLTNIKVGCVDVLKSAMEQLRSNDFDLSHYTDITPADPSIQTVDSGVNETDELQPVVDNTIGIVEHTDDLRKTVSMKNDMQQKIREKRSKSDLPCVKSTRPVRKRKITARLSDYLFESPKVRSKKTKSDKNYNTATEGEIEENIKRDVNPEETPSDTPDVPSVKDKGEPNASEEEIMERSSDLKAHSDSAEINKPFSKQYAEVKDIHVEEIGCLVSPDIVDPGSASCARISPRKSNNKQLKVQNGTQVNMDDSDSSEGDDKVETADLANGDRVNARCEPVGESEEPKLKPSPVVRQKHREKPARGKFELPMYKRKDIKCPTCGKVGTKAMVDYHRQIHSEEMPYTCEVCGKGFKTRACLSAHKRQHGERKYKCDLCPAAFFRNAYLVAHKRRHTGDLPFICDLCGDKFKERYILQRHISNVHEGQRNHHCDICGEKFFRSDTRDSHRQRHFEPSLKCQYCSKMFKAELDKRKHELTHTGEKQYYCPLCKVGFSQLWPYYRHMEKKHNMDKDTAKQVRVRNNQLVFLRKKNNEVLDEGQVSADNSLGLSRPSSGESVYRTEERRAVQYDGLKGAGNKAEFDVSMDEAIDETGLQVYGEMDAAHNIYSRVGSDHHLYSTDGVVGTVGSVVLGECLSEATSVVTLDRQNTSMVLDDGQMVEQRNIVILNDYVPADLEEYTKQFNSSEI